MYYIPMPRTHLKEDACQFVLYNILKALLIILFPILSFTCEQAYKHLKHTNFISCYLENYPNFSDFNLNLDEISTVEKHN
jgi:isoleucyl-tRNA synthetase